VGGSSYNITKMKYRTGQLFKASVTDEENISPFYTDQVFVNV
jgi:hypothetical protein